MTNRYCQPTTRTLPLPGPVREDPTPRVRSQTPIPVTQPKGHRPCAVLGSRTRALGPRVGKPKNQRCEASRHPSLLQSPSPHPPGAPGGASPFQPPHGSWPRLAVAAAPLLPMSEVGPAPGLRCSGGMRRRLQRPATHRGFRNHAGPHGLPYYPPRQEVTAQRGKLRGRGATGSLGPQGVKQYAWHFLQGFHFSPIKDSNPSFTEVQQL